MFFQGRNGRIPGLFAGGARAMAEIDAQALARDADLAEIARIYVPDLAKREAEMDRALPVP